LKIAPLLVRTGGARRAARIDDFCFSSASSAVLAGRDANPVGKPATLAAIRANSAGSLHTDRGGSRDRNRLRPE
jgi:hypothetical protein